MCEGDTILPRRQRPRRRAAPEFPAVQSLPSLSYTETPQRYSTLSIDPHSDAWSCKVLLLTQTNNDVPLDWIVAATVQGNLVFWKFAELPTNTALNVAVSPTQTVSLINENEKNTSLDRIIRLIHQEDYVLVVTILGKVYKVCLGTSDETHGHWELKEQWRMGEDVVNIRHVIAWNNDTLICATESDLMAWNLTKSCLWKHRIDDIMAMEFLGADHLMVVPHGQAVQVLDLRLLSMSILEATVLARPGYELLPSTTEGQTVIHRRETDSGVVLACSDGQCFLAGVMEDRSEGSFAWGVIGTPVPLPVPAIGIGTNPWGDVLYCLPAGSTIAADITGTITGAWMLPVGTGEQEDIMIPVEGFCSMGEFCVYQWPNGAIDIFRAQNSVRQLLTGLVEDGVAHDLMNWLLQTETATLSVLGDNYAQAQKELARMASIEMPMDELFLLAPTLRTCLLLLARD